MVDKGTNELLIELLIVIILKAIEGQSGGKNWKTTLTREAGENLSRKVTKVAVTNVIGLYLKREGCGTTAKM